MSTITIDGVAVDANTGYVRQPDNSSHYEPPGRDDLEMAYRERAEHFRQPVNLLDLGGGVIGELRHDIPDQDDLGDRLHDALMTHPAIMTAAGLTVAAAAYLITGGPTEILEACSRVLVYCG